MATHDTLPPVMKHTSRNILPAASTLPVQSYPETSNTRIKKRQSVQRACNACRKIKCKCDGVRPVCAKCIERHTECIYDTKEGMTRNASLRDTNESLQAKIEMYKEVFEGLLDNNPTVATRDHIKTLGLSPRTNNRARSTTAAYSQVDNGNDSTFAPDSPSDNDSASHPARDPFPEQNTRLGSEPFPSHDPHTEWLATGFDPNDGRISGKQEGWHPILVVRQSQEIQSSGRTNESQDGDPWLPYRRPQYNQGSYVYGHPGVDGDNLDVFHLQPEHRSHALQTSTWQYHNSNDSSMQTSPFSPPPGAVTAYGNLPMSSAILANGYPPSIQRRQLLNFRVPEHTIPPLLVEENSDMSRLYVGFKDAALELIGNGASAPEILGDCNVVCVDLFIRDRVSGDPYTVCSWACELIKHMPEFDMFVQLAWIALLARFMRWIIHPTADNYAKVPSMIRPIKVQRLIPHSPALDLCPHPAFREALMHHYRDWITPSHVINGGLTCWIKDLDSAVVMCPNTGQMILTEEFERETQKKDAWTMSQEILSTFPDASKFGVKMRDAPLNDDNNNNNNNNNGQRWEDSQAFNMQGVSNGIGGGSRADTKRRQSQGSTSTTNGMSKMDIDQGELREGIDFQESVGREQRRLRLAKLPSF